MPKRRSLSIVRRAIVSGQPSVMFTRGLLHPTEGIHRWAVRLWHPGLASLALGGDIKHFLVGKLRGRYHQPPAVN